MAQQILSADNVLLNVHAAAKEEAIKIAGNLLVEQGYVEASYIDKMMEREELTSTYMGNFVAIPHGTEDAKKSVKTSGLSIVQIPDGVDFGGGIVKLVIGIAGKDGEHLEILSKIALVCADEDKVNQIINATSKSELLSFFEEVN
ncbi:PTS sugar transporter subunit IIA [Bacillus taeanensis]|uniref:Mannitol-specific phosphotransferase enzyme IIA component n=1 Tax=Bacillus taeanensis TaxID=273032 RepID=A0A366XQS5_9BACI|nr:PTS sugar transporter subunit IIA [Bacillus taeanensis]RBW68066.1 PTS mannitol transporter subunit IIA [Bacillus taeanensis]